MSRGRPLPDAVVSGSPSRAAPRFAFAVPLKPRRLCSDWELTQINLRRTLRSVERAAADHSAQIVIACHDEPDLAEIDRTNITVLRVPFPEPEDISEGTRDKARKRRHIGAWLGQSRGDDMDVVFLDADDLVHKGLLEAVSRSGHASHLVTDGYLVDVATGIVSLRRGTFHRSCGSSFICRFAIDELPTSWEDTSSPFSQFGSSPEQRGHQDYDQVAAELGRPPVQLGFPGVVYLVNHGESMWRAKGRGSRTLEYPRELIFPTAARRLLADEFGAPDLAHDITGYFGAATVFSRAVLRRLRTRGARRHLR